MLRILTVAAKAFELTAPLLSTARHGTADRRRYSGLIRPRADRPADPQLLDGVAQPDDACPTEVPSLRGARGQLAVTDVRR